MDTPCDLDSWVNAAPGAQQEFRRAVQVILAAITHDLGLRDAMVMKGGLLMAIRYDSRRFTKDLDFSTPMKREELDTGEFRGQLERSLAKIVSESEHDLDCRIQRCRLNPPNDDFQFPNLELTVGYAYKGSNKHNRLLLGKSPTTIEIDFSLNEPVIDVESLDVGKGQSLRAYAFTDLVAEKLRSLMQQEIRNRYRRQDIYDLRMLIEPGVDKDKKLAILASLKELKRGLKGVGPVFQALTS